MPKSLSDLAREADQAEYAARCQEVSDLRVVIAAAKKQIEALTYERERARELQAQAEARFPVALGERERLKEALVELINGSPDQKD